MFTGTGLTLTAEVACLQELVACRHGRGSACVTVHWQSAAHAGHTACLRQEQPVGSEERKESLDAAALVRLPVVCLAPRTPGVTHCCRAQELPASVEAVGASALVLDASNNRLTALPASLGALSGLTRLVVPNNALRALPPQLAALTSLRARPDATLAPRAHQPQGAHNSNLAPPRLPASGHALTQPSERNPQGRRPPGDPASAPVPCGGRRCLDRPAGRCGGRAARTNRVERSVQRAAHAILGGNTPRAGKLQEPQGPTRSGS